MKSQLLRLMLCGIIFQTLALYSHLYPCARSTIDIWYRLWYHENESAMVSLTRRKRLLETIRQRRCKNVRFGDLCWLLEAYGFVLDRTHGSHHVYTHPRLERILTVPKPHGTPEVKPVYCRQALEAIEDVVAFEDKESDEYGD